MDQVDCCGEGSLGLLKGLRASLELDAMVFPSDDGESFSSLEGESVFVDTLFLPHQ